MDEKQALAEATMKAIAYQENGGKPDLNNLKAGKTGEMKSIFQYTPDSWKRDAGEILGDPNAKLTPDAETYVTLHKVKKWIDKGYNAKQIASMWNAGPGEPDAYTGKFSNGKPSKGVNAKYGVRFDVPTYANKVSELAKKFYTKDYAPKLSTNQLQQPQQPVTQPTVPTPKRKDPLLSLTPNISIPSL